MAPLREDSGPRVRGVDLFVYGIVGVFVGLGALGQPVWARADPRLPVWSAWHSGQDGLDPWGNPFDDALAGGLRSGGPNASLGDDDDVAIPRVAPGELTLFELLAWLPWILGLGLAISWEGLRWLRRPGSRQLSDEAPLALIGGLIAGVGVGASVELGLARSRVARDLLSALPGALPPTLSLGGSAAIAVGLGLLVLRLRLARAPASPLEGDPGVVDA